MRLAVDLSRLLAPVAPAGVQPPSSAPEPSIADGPAQAALDDARATRCERGVRDHASGARLPWFRLRP